MFWVVYFYTRQGFGGIVQSAILTITLACLALLYTLSVGSVRKTLKIDEKAKLTPSDRLSQGGLCRFSAWADRVVLSQCPDSPE